MRVGISKCFRSCQVEPTGIIAKGVVDGEVCNHGVTRRKIPIEPLFIYVWIKLEMQICEMQYASGMTIIITNLGEDTWQSILTQYLYVRMKPVQLGMGYAKEITPLALL